MEMKQLVQTICGQGGQLAISEDAPKQDAEELQREELQREELNKLKQQIEYLKSERERVGRRGKAKGDRKENGVGRSIEGSHDPVVSKG